MTDIDREILEALDAEDKELLSRFEEQGLFEQWFSIYRGPQAWIVALSTLVMFPLFIGAVYSGYQFFALGDDVAAIRWGALAFALLTMTAFIKVWLWIRMESNRVLREVKRVELQVARLSARLGV